MRKRFIRQVVLMTFLLCQSTICPAAESSDPPNPSCYLDAVREFADNVLKYGRDIYGPKHTPLFVDGLNIHTHEPVKWIAPNGDRWILSNLASQQNLFRTLDGLTKITGDPKYKQAAMEAIKYAFDNLRSPNGLLYWGNGTAYDAQGEKACGWRVGDPYAHCLKANLPYYELMWQVNPEATKAFIESFWSANVIDWSNLAMNRTGQFYDELEIPWQHEYRGGPTFLESGSGQSFFNAGTDLIYAAVLLTKLSGDKEPLEWAKRLIQRYVQTRHPKTGISYWMYTKPKWKEREQYDDIMRRLVPGTTEFIPSEFPWFQYTNSIFREASRGQFTPTPGISVHKPVFYWQTQFLVGEMLDGDGKDFKQWALEELTAFGKTSYRKEDNVYVPMLTDGTKLEGYVVKEDGPLGPKGVVLESVPAGSSDFWAYTMGYRVTRDEFMWKMVHSIAKGNEFGDLGVTPKDKPRLNFDAGCANPYALLAFLELNRATCKKGFLEMAKKIGDNILGNRFHKGFFVASNRHIYTKFDAVDSLALLHLCSALAGDKGIVPQVWPSLPYFICPYRNKDATIDNTILYTLTEFSELPFSLQEAAAEGDLKEVRAMISRGADVNGREDPSKKTALHRAAMGGHNDVVELLLTKGADIEAGKFDIGTALHYAAQRGHRGTAEFLIANGADISAKNNDGQTPVDIAVSRNRIEVVKVLIEKGADVSLYTASRVGALAKVKSLIEKGADVNAKETSGRTALHYATDKGHKDMAELLIANGAEVNAKNNDGQTPVDIALQGRRWDIIRALIDAGADVTQANVEGQTLLHIVTRRNQKDLVKILLDKGVDVNAGDNKGQTPLHIAAERGHREIIELLLAHGARIDAKDRQGVTPALAALLYGWYLHTTDLLLEKRAEATGPHLAAYTGNLSRIRKLLDTNSAGDDYKGLTLLHAAAAGGRLELVNYLIDKGFDVKASTESGLTPLHYAVMGDHQAVAEILIAQGAPVDEAQPGPLFAAAWAGYKNMAQYLISKGADINKGRETPLHLAVSWWNLDMAKLLLELGANIDARDEEGNTPLHWTVNEWYTAMANYLISKGANIDARNKQGRTALHEAADGWNTPMAKLLIENGASVHIKDDNGQTPLTLAKENRDTETAELLRKYQAKADLWVLPRKIEGINPSDMMKRYLLRQAQWKSETWRNEYEQRKTTQQVAEYQERLREEFIEAIGGLPERTPLNARVTKVVRREGYQVEMVIFESQPKHYVSGVLFLPDSKHFQPPYPGVLALVGHSLTAKFRDVYQTMGALLALNGIASLVFDPIDQGERGQLLSEWPTISTTIGHTMIGVGSILLGRNTARFEIWDGMRAIDYLQSRPEIDPHRIGCSGVSGGGTQTAYLVALDDRVKAAAPACWITNFERLFATIGPQDAEQNIYGQLGFGMDEADFLMMRAPTPTLICAATEDFIDIKGTWTSFRYAKRLYTRLGFSERIDLMEYDGKHSYNKPTREATTHWMKRWLRNEDERVSEPSIVLLSEKEIQCTPNGQVMLLPDARSAYDLNRDFNKELADRRKELWVTTRRAELFDRIRRLCGIRELSDLPEPTVENVGVITRPGYTIRKAVLKPEQGIYLPALMFVPGRKPYKGAVLYLHEDGKATDAGIGGPIEKLVNSGKVVLAVDLRGTGETQRVGQINANHNPHFGPDWKDFFIAYLLGRSYVGMRTEDVLVCSRFLQEAHETPVALIAVGHVSIPALHAAAIEPDTFCSVKLIRPLFSWSNVIEVGQSRKQLINVVHGALAVYDLPDLARTLGSRLVIEQPLNALGEPIEE